MHESRKHMGWRIFLQDYDDYTTVLASHPPMSSGEDLRAHYLEVIQRLCSYYSGHLVEVSQVTTKYKSVQKSTSLANKLKEKYKCDVMISKDIRDSLLGGAEDRYSALIARGIYSPELMDEILEFGIHSLDMIISIPKECYTPCWYKEIAERDALFAEWFYLKSDDDISALLLEGVELLIWTSDGNLMFAATTRKQLVSYLSVLYSIADQYGWELVFTFLGA